MKKKTFYGLINVAAEEFVRLSVLHTENVSINATKKLGIEWQTDKKAARKMSPLNFNTTFKLFKSCNIYSLHYFHFRPCFLILFSITTHSLYSWQ